MKMVKKVSRVVDMETGKKVFKVEFTEEGFKEWIGNKRDALKEFGEDVKQMSKNPTLRIKAKKLAVAVIKLTVASYLLNACMGAIAIVAAWIIMFTILLPLVSEVVDTLSQILAGLKSNAVPA